MSNVEHAPEYAERIENLEAQMQERITHDKEQDTALAAIPVASSAQPLAPGTASAGEATDYARGDHVHPEQTDVTKWNGAAKTVSTSAASGGSDGDIWFQYIS